MHRGPSFPARDRPAREGYPRLGSADDPEASPIPSSHRTRPPGHVVVPKVHTMELDGVAGRTVFPTPDQGPWLPLERFAESRAVGRRVSSDPHPHRLEEVVNYVLSGRMIRTGGGEPEAELGAGTVSRLTAHGSVTHDVYPAPGSEARWISIVTRLPSVAPSPAPPSRDVGLPRVHRLSGGVGRKNLVGPKATLPSLAGLEAVDLTIPPGRSFRVSVGTALRAVVYAVGGSGSVQGRPIAEGAGLLAEDLEALELKADSEFRVILATVPSPTYAPGG